jgi:hypothetical protein
LLADSMQPYPPQPPDPLRGFFDFWR